MREAIRDRGRLQHMLEAIDNVNEFTQGVTLEELVDNKMLRHAVAHNLQIIGEAAYKLTKEFCASHPEVLWKDVIGLRHVLVHDYYKIDFPELWIIIHEELPPLRKQVMSFIEELPETE
ncbi:MAG: DUF86 domain-containing protein [Bacteroidales bacterium]|nr:DUF86 domain-containing protein [Bacteroidales bacterium]